MCKSFYNFLIRGKIGTIDFFEWLNVARKYEMVKKAKDVVSISTHGPLFVELESGTVETNCIFYENLMIILHRDFEKDDKIIRIFVKRPEDVWSFSSFKAVEGIITPLNLNAEVYIKYDVSVLKLNRCYGEEYRSGNWNKMFFKTIRSLIKEVAGFTEINKISEAYNDRRDKKEN